MRTVTAPITASQARARHRRSGVLLRAPSPDSLARYTLRTQRETMPGGDSARAFEKWLRGDDLAGGLEGAALEQLVAAEGAEEVHGDVEGASRKVCKSTIRAPTNL